jgi:hypothetical protein
MEYLYNLGKITRALDPFDPYENHERNFQMDEIAKHYATRSIQNLRRQPRRENVLDIASEVWSRAYNPSVYFSGGLVGIIAKEHFAPPGRPDFERLNLTPQVHGFDALTARYNEDAHYSGAFYARFVLKMADPFWLLCPDVSHDVVMSRKTYLEIYSKGKASNSTYLCYWFDRSVLPASILLFAKALSGSVYQWGAIAALATLIADVNKRIETSLPAIDRARQTQKTEEVRNLERELAKKLFEMTVQWGKDEENCKALRKLHESGSIHEYQHKGKENFLAFEECISRAVFDILSHSKQWERVQTKRSLTDCVGSFYDFESRVSATEKSAASEIQNWIGCIPETHELIRTYWYDKYPPGSKLQTKEPLRADIASVIEEVDSKRRDFKERDQPQDDLPSDIESGRYLDVEKLILGSLKIEADRHPDLDWDNHTPIFKFILDQWKRGYGYGPSRSTIGRAIREKLGGITAFRKIKGVPQSSGTQEQTIARDIVSILHDWRSYITEMSGGEAMKGSHSRKYLDKCVRYEMPGKRSADGDSWILKGGANDRISITVECAIQYLNTGSMDSTLTKEEKRLVCDEYIPTALYAVYAERLATDHYQTPLATRKSSRNLHKRLSQWAEKLYCVNDLKLVDGYETDLLSVQLNDNASSLFFPETILSVIKCMGSKNFRNVASMLKPVHEAIGYMKIPNSALEVIPIATALLRTLMIKDGVEDYSTIEMNGIPNELFDIRDISEHPVGIDANERKRSAQTAAICLWGIVAMVEEVFGLNEGNMLCKYK